MGCSSGPVINNNVNAMGISDDNGVIISCSSLDFSGALCRTRYQDGLECVFYDGYNKGGLDCNWP
jgi:hypothetical protein